VTELRFSLAYPTGNRKVGGKTGRLAATSVTSRPSCPSTCAFYRTTQCYAENHWAAQNWNRVDEKGVHIGEFRARLAKLPPTVLWRHNVSGDLPHRNLTIDTHALMSLVAAGRHLRGFTYTHHQLSPTNLRAIRIANASGFTINASTESVTGADAVLDQAPGLPVVTIVPTGTGKHTRTPQGRRVVVCPADYRDDWDCARCADNSTGLPLCGRPERDFIVGFLPKGASKKKVSTLAASGAPA
jgi:hypothetical protein